MQRYALASSQHPCLLFLILLPDRSFSFLQGAYHEKVVPVVCGLVSDASQPVRVRGHAAAAIVNFTDTDGVPEEAIAPHLDSLLSALCSCLNGGVPQSVQVRVPHNKLWGFDACMCGLLFSWSLSYSRLDCCGVKIGFGGRRYFRGRSMTI